MKTRLKNWITSIFGVVILCFALIMLAMTVFGDKDFSYGTMGLFGFIGYTFLMAKDTLINGLFFNLLKLKE